MAENTKKDFTTVKINGIEIKSLKGGFLAYVPSGINGRDKNPSSQKKDNPQNHPEKKEGQHLLCDICGTVIKVHPPGRIARCCNQNMTPLVRASSAKDSKKSGPEKSMEAGA